MERRRSWLRKRKYDDAYDYLESSKKVIKNVKDKTALSTDSVNLLNRRALLNTNVNIVTGLSLK